LQYCGVFSDALLRSGIAEARIAPSIGNIFPVASLKKERLDIISFLSIITFLSLIKMDIN